MSGLRVTSYGLRVTGCELRDAGCSFGERINSMKYFVFIDNIYMDLPGKAGRQIEAKDLSAVSLVKRAEEGDIYNVTSF